MERLNFRRVVVATTSDRSLVKTISGPPYLRRAFSICGPDEPSFFDAGKFKLEVISDRLDRSGDSGMVNVGSVRIRFAVNRRKRGSAALPRLAR